MSYFLFSACILSIFAITAAIRIYKGIRVGFMKTLIALSVNILCIVTSMILSPIFGRWISNLINLYNFSSYLGAMNPQKVQIIRACFAMAISIVLFLILFIVTRLIAALFLHHLNRRRLKPSHTAPNYTTEGHSWISRNDKVLGAVTGLCCAILTTMVLTSPLMGVADIAGRACDMAESADEKLNLKITIDVNLDDVKKYSQNISGNIFYQFGGKYMISTVAQGKIGDQNVYFFHEVEAVEQTMERLLAILPVFQDPTKAQPSDLEQIDALCESINDMQLSSIFLPNFLSEGSQAWLKGQRYWGIYPPVTNNMIQPLWSEVLRACNTSTISTAKQDLTTLLRVYQIFLQNEVFSWDITKKEATLTQLTQGNLLSQLENELARSQQMKHITNEVPTIALHILSCLIFENETSSTPSEAYLMLIEDLGEAFISVKSKGYATSEEVVAVYTLYTQQYLKNYGVDVPSEIATILASSLLSEIAFPPVSDLSSQIDTFFKSLQ